MFATTDMQTYPLPITRFYFQLSVVCSALCLGSVGCTGKSSAFPLSLETVRQLSSTNTAHISFAERDEDLFVSVTDRHGDSHIHQLDLGTNSKPHAVELLRQKQAELKAQP